MMTNYWVSLVSFLCATWVLCFLLFGGNDPGRSFYAHLAEALLGDAKGGVPIQHLGLPVLIAGSLASFCWTLPSLSYPSLSSIISSPSTSTNHQRHTHTLPHWIHRWRHRLQSGEGDWNLDVWAMLLILVPSICYLAMTIYRHLHGKEMSLDDQLMDTSNAFGMLAEVVGSFLLIPVARNSSLLKVMGWSPARAVRLHIWTGRIFILAVLVHGGMHMFRWSGLANESLVGMLIPPPMCWTMDTEQYTTVQPQCIDADTDCKCYDLFRNLTGFLAAVALMVILITSLHQVRRQFYRLFYISHVIAAPLAIILVVLHWNRSILYMAPSLLYYVASSFPVFAEGWMQQRSMTTRGVEVVSIEQIPTISDLQYKKSDNLNDLGSTGGGHHISLTVRATEAAVRQFRPGYYVQLLAPEVSNVSHPFTVNLVPGKHDQLRIIFKVLGKFTSQLSDRAQQAVPPPPVEQQQQHHFMPALDQLPAIHVNGYLGTPNRVREVLQHDVATMIAGGIGITPYLTLLHHVHDLLAQAPPNTFATKRIVLLWICRDASLVDYVRQEYLQPLLECQHKANVDFKIKVVIYHTGDGLSSAAFPFHDEENPLGGDSLMVAKKTSTPVPVSIGRPFAPSRFATGLSWDFKSNMLGFIAFFCTAWGGAAAVWWIYTIVQGKDRVASRIWGLVAMLLIGMIVSVLVNILACLPYFQGEGESNRTSWSPLPTIDQEASASEDPIQASVIEMEVTDIRDLNEGNGEISDDEEESNDAASSPTPVVTIDEKRGRPTVHQMLKFVDNARRPGLFTCGPLTMMQSIRETTEERCMLRLQQCMRGASHHIALYEEAFNM